MTTVNRISAPAEERVGLFTEEMGEAQQIIGKILRHGLDSTNPVGPSMLTNQNLLELESGHVLAALDLLMERGTLSRKAVEEARLQKLKKLQQWLHWNENLVGVEELLHQALREPAQLAWERYRESEEGSGLSQVEMEAARRAFMAGRDGR